MPHLSPLSWLLLTLLFLLTLLLVFTNNWWLQTPLFRSLNARLTSLSRNWPTWKN